MKKQTKILLGVLVAVVVIGAAGVLLTSSELFQGRLTYFARSMYVENFDPNPGVTVNEHEKTYFKWNRVGSGWSYYSDSENYLCFEPAGVVRSDEYCLEALDSINSWKNFGYEEWEEVINNLYQGEPIETTLSFLWHIRTDFTKNGKTLSRTSEPWEINVNTLENSGGLQPTSF